MELYYKNTSSIRNSFKQICEEYEITKRAASRGLIDNDESNMKRQFRQRIKRLMENGVLLVSKNVYDFTLQNIFPKNSEMYSEDYELMLKHQPQKRDLWHVISKDKVVWEHMVPATVLVEYVWKRLEEGNFTFEDFEAVRTRYGGIALVTHEEDKELVRLGYRQRMPEGWEVGDSEFARYDKAKIKIK